MGRRSGWLVPGVVLAGVLSGCASTGVLKGRLSLPGQPAAPVTLAFQSDRLGGGGTLSTTLPDGESFSGKYVQMTSATAGEVAAPMSQGWEPFWGGWGAFGEPWFEGGGYETFRVNYSGKVIATLFGDKGSNMRCRLTLADPPSGLAGSGTGECQLSGGGKIDVQF